MGNLLLKLLPPLVLLGACALSRMSIEEQLAEAHTDLDKGQILYERACQRSIARAEEHLSVSQADKVRAGHLGLQPGDPVVVIERLAYGFNGQALEWRRSHGPAQHFNYHIEIR